MSDSQTHIQPSDCVDFFFFFEIQSHYVALDDLELTMLSRLALNSQR